MIFRLSRPDVLVDINFVVVLDHVDAAAGTLVLHARFERLICAGRSARCCP